MSMTRRKAIKLIAASIPALSAARALGVGMGSSNQYLSPRALEAMRSLGREMESGPKSEKGLFQGTRESLRAYKIPQWFADAKFGIWAHWGPQSAIEHGDWYARSMYMQGSPQYKYHVEHYGHPSKFGYKDTIPLWKADKFDPDFLVSLYKKAGAKYFMSMGVHHDNFDLWNSKYTRWNSVKMGPKRDIVGEFKRATQNHGLKFAVSDHLWISPKWFSVSHGSDKTGPMAGVPYDGTNPRNFDLYHDVKKIYWDLPWNENGIPDSWKQRWFLRIKDLVDKYEPDLLYSDGHIPFEEWGLSLVAHLYNKNANRHHGEVQAVYTSKRREDSETGTCAFDVERGVVDAIWPRPWQTETCIGNWHYDVNAQYKSPKMIMDMLVDVVSRNGNYMLNFPLPNSGMLDDRELKILSEITAWMAVNNQAIYGTRPWKIFGEGPATAQLSHGDSQFNESKRKELTFDDVRFTTKGDTLYTFFMGWPEKEVNIPSLGTSRRLFDGKIQNVELLGFDGKVQWIHSAEGLKVQLPSEKPCNYACALKISGSGLV
jgi:alpha-L-fucosidase